MVGLILAFHSRAPVTAVIPVFAVRIFSVIHQCYTGFSISGGIVHGVRLAVPVQPLRCPRYVNIRGAEREHACSQRKGYLNKRQLGYMGNTRIKPRVKETPYHIAYYEPARFYCAYVALIVKPVC